MVLIPKSSHTRHSLFPGWLKICFLPSMLLELVHSLPTLCSGLVIVGSWVACDTYSPNIFMLMEDIECMEKLESTLGFVQEFREK